MDEEQLKALLGENYDGAKDFFKDQVLGNGDYVNAGKAKAEKDELQRQLDAANQKIKDQMSDDDKKLADAAAKDQLIADLQKQLSENTIETNKSKAIGNMAEAITLIGLKSDDKDFNAFVSNIATEDANKTIETSKYISKIVKNAYEKGKSEATKQNLGKIGGFNANGSDSGSSSGSGDSIATRLAKQNSNKTTESAYFKN